MLRLLFVALAMLATGCHVDLNDPGTDPLPGQFYFPSGLVLDPEGQFLYVSNHNSDLRYAGGTIQMVDLNRFECARARARVRLGLDMTDMPLPGSMCEEQKVVSDSAMCFHDPSDPSTINCGMTPNDTLKTPSLPYILDQQTVKVGNFAGNMVLQARPWENVGKRRLFIGVRGDPSVTWIDTFPNNDADGARKLNCVDDTNPMLPHTLAPGCTTNHVIQTYNCTSQQNLTQLPCTDVSVVLPAEPFGITYDEGVHAANEQPGYARLLVSHLSGGQVSLIDVLAPDQLGIESISSPFFTADSTGRHGNFALAPQHPGDASSLWYMTANNQPNVATFRIADVKVVVPAPTFSVGAPFASGNDVRAIAFDQGGNRAFLTDNNPPSLIVLDTRTLPVSGSVLPGTPTNTVLDVINVCSTPSHLTLRTVEVPGAPGQPSRLATRVYVTCFQSNQIMVVDPDLAVVTDTILVGRGPNDLVFADGPSITEANRHPRAYVTNFSEMTIGVIDVERGSKTENRMIARIGVPVPPPLP